MFATYIVSIFTIKKDGVFSGVFVNMSKVPQKWTFIESFYKKSYGNKLFNLKTRFRALCSE